MYIMVDVTTLRIHKGTKKELDKFKIHPREPYEEVLKRLMKKTRKDKEAEDPRERALNYFTKKIRKEHQDQVKDIILYGSYARGESTPESDVDVLVIWSGELARGRKTAAELAIKALVNYDVLISPKVISPKNYENMKKLELPFMKAIQSEGIKIGALKLNKVIKQNLKKASERLDAAQILLQNEKYEGVVNRAYYSIFHSAKALLSTEGISPKTHRGLIRKFGEKFVKTGDIPQEYAAILSKAESLRETADYGLMTEIGFEDAKSIVEGAEKFLKMAEEHIC